MLIGQRRLLYLVWPTNQTIVGTPLLDHVPYQVFLPVVRCEY